MKDLKQVDIICANSVNPNEGALAIQHCQKFFNFGKSILFTDIDGEAEGIEVVNISKMSSVGDYNDFMLGIGKYLDNDYVLVVQDDGHIINPELWDDEFLNYDYIGAPWPLESKWIDGFRDEISERMWRVLPKNRVGNGGFSLRSKKYLEFSSKFSSCEGWGEDEFLCQIHYEKAIDFGIKFAPFELALKFSYENALQEMGTPWGSYVSLDRSKHFGWHGKNFANTHELMSIKHN
jgi:hypothetical protein